MTRRISLILLVLILGVIGPACGDDKKSGRNPQDGSTDEDGGTMDGATDGATEEGDSAVSVPEPTVRVVNAVSSLAAVDGYVNGAFTTPLFSEVAFTTATAAVTVPSGNYALQFVSSDAETPNGDDVRAELSETIFTAGQNYTVITLGDVELQEEARAYAELLPPDDGKARIRFINGSPAAGNLNVYKTDGDDVLLASDVAPFANEMVQVVVAMAFQIGVDFTDDDVPDLTFDIPALPSNLRANAVFTYDTNSDGLYKLIVHFQNTAVVNVITGVPVPD